MRVGSLFTGYGGLDMAVGGDLAWYAEIEPAACQVLTQHHPDVPNLGDITKIDWSQVEPVDIITGGYPCQPFSHAGSRKGKNDERHLWPYVRDAIHALRPSYAILENVSGHLTLGLADVLADLAEIGWSAEWGTYRASDVGAPHRRERVFIIAHTNSKGSQRFNTRPKDAIRPGTRGVASDSCGIVSANADNSGWVENVKQSSHIAATPGEGQPSVIDGSGADRDAATRSGALAAADTINNGLQHTSKRVDTRQGSDATTGHSSPATDTDNGHRQTVGEVPRLERHAPRSDMLELSDVNWGKYEAAIRRWEDVLGRLAPSPTTPGRNDRPRLNPQFVEWMMGLPEGHVTGHGLSAAKELKMLGNGVVPQQAAAAISQLMERTA